MLDSVKLVESLKLSDLLLLLVAVVWGASYGLAKEALLFYPVLGFLAIRFTMTFLLLLPFLAKEIASGRLVQAVSALPLGLVLLVIFLLETYGVMYTSASNAAFLISLFVIFTPFVEWAVLGNRPANSIFFLAFISLMGAWLLVSDVTYVFNYGDSLIIGAAFCRALMVSLTKRYTIQSELSALSLTAIQSLVVAVGASVLFFYLYRGEVMALPSSFTFWRNTVFLVVFCTIFAFFAQNYGVKKSSPSRVSFLMGTEPLFGALFAVAWLGEELTTSAWFGGGLIVMACTLSTQPQWFEQLIKQIKSSLATN